jgi:hypothetical protein
MISAWTKHLTTPEEKQEFKNIFKGSKPVLERLDELINEIELDTDSLELNPKVYDIPNWSYRQADLNGYRRALKQIKRLISADNAA